MTPLQISDLRGARYEIEKKEEGGDQKSLGKNYPVERTSEKLAKEYGVSEKTIRSDAKLHGALDKLSTEEKAEVLAGKSGKTKQEFN